MARATQPWAETDVGRPAVRDLGRRSVRRALLSADGRDPLGPGRPRPRRGRDPRPCGTCSAGALPLLGGGAARGLMPRRSRAGATGRPAVQVPYASGQPSRTLLLPFLLGGPSRPEEVNLREYECMLILPAEADEALVSTAVDRIAQAHRAAGGEIGTLDRWGRKRFAFEIDDQHEGYYVVLRFTADPVRPAGARPRAEDRRRGRSGTRS